MDDWGDGGDIVKSVDFLFNTLNCVVPTYPGTFGLSEARINEAFSAVWHGYAPVLRELLFALQNGNLSGFNSNAAIHEWFIPTGGVFSLEVSGFSECHSSTSPTDKPVFTPATLSL